MNIEGEGHYHRGHPRSLTLTLINSPFLRPPSSTSTDASRLTAPRPPIDESPRHRFPCLYSSFHKPPPFSLLQRILTLPAAPHRPFTLLPYSSPPSSSPMPSPIWVVLLSPDSHGNPSGQLRTARPCDRARPGGTSDIGFDQTRPGPELPSPEGPVLIPRFTPSTPSAPLSSFPIPSSFSRPNCVLPCGPVGPPPPCVSGIYRSEKVTFKRWTMEGRRGL